MWYFHGRLYRMEFADQQTRSNPAYILSKIKNSMKTYYRLEVQLHTFLTSAQGGGEWLYSQTGHFAIGQTTRVNH